MGCIDKTPVELFAHVPHHMRSIMYRRFADTAEAIRFAVEDIPAAKYVVIEVDENRISQKEIRKLYRRRQATTASMKRRRRRAQSVGSISRAHHLP
jgi:hypothetical protein